MQPEILLSCHIGGERLWMIGVYMARAHRRLEKISEGSFPCSRQSISRDLLNWHAWSTDLAREAAGPKRCFFVALKHLIDNYDTACSWSMGNCKWGPWDGLRPPTSVEESYLRLHAGVRCVEASQSLPTNVALVDNNRHAWIVIWT